MPDTPYILTGNTKEGFPCWGITAPGGRWQQGGQYVVVMANDLLFVYQPILAADLRPILQSLSESTDCQTTLGKRCRVIRFDGIEEWELVEHNSSLRSEERRVGKEW